MPKVIELCLCEQDSIVLKPNQLYQFRIAPDCNRCARMANFSGDLKGPAVVCDGATMQQLRLTNRELRDTNKLQREIITKIRKALQALLEL